MSVSDIVASGRAAAEARMTSRCTVRRKTDETTIDADGFEVPVWGEVYVDHPMRLAGVIRGESQSRRIEAAGTEFQIALRTAHFPATTADLSDGDLLEITSGENAGLVLQIVEAAWQDQATSRRVPVVETTRPEEWS